MDSGADGTMLMAAAPGKKEPRVRASHSTSLASRWPRWYGQKSSEKVASSPPSTKPKPLKAWAFLFSPSALTIFLAIHCNAMGSDGMRALLPVSMAHVNRKRNDRKATISRAVRARARAMRGENSADLLRTREVPGLRRIRPCRAARTAGRSDNAG